MQDDVDEPSTFFPLWIQTLDFISLLDIIVGPVQLPKPRRHQEKPDVI